MRTAFCSYLDVSRDLAERIMNRSNELNGFLQAASFLKTKELTQSRIQRALLHIILGIRKCLPFPTHAYLVFEGKRTLLKEIKDSSRFHSSPSLLTQALSMNPEDRFLYETVFSSTFTKSCSAGKWQKLRSRIPETACHPVKYRKTITDFLNPESIQISFISDGFYFLL